MNNIVINNGEKHKAITQRDVESQSPPNHEESINSQHSLFL